MRVCGAGQQRFWLRAVGEARLRRRGSCGDLVQRRKLEQARAARAIVRRKDDVTLRVYLVEARTHLFRWLVTLGFPSQSDDWKGVARDDASAAITFSRLILG